MSKYDMMTIENILEDLETDWDISLNFFRPKPASNTHYWCEFCNKFIKNTSIVRKQQIDLLITNVNGPVSLATHTAQFNLIISSDRTAKVMKMASPIKKRRPKRLNLSDQDQSKRT